MEFGYLPSPPIGDMNFSEALLQYAEPEKQSIYNSLMYSDISGLGAEEAIQLISEFLGYSRDFRKKRGYQAALHMLMELKSRDSLSASARSKIHLLIANVYVRLWQNDPSRYVWNDENIENALYNYRCAITPELMDALHPTQIARLFTDYGNLLNLVGRLTEAIEQFDRALSSDPSLMMARGSRGQCLWAYASLYTHPSHAGYLASSAYSDLMLSSLFLPRPRVTSHFYSHAQSIKQSTLTDPSISTYADLPEVSLGSSDEEIQYRRWCLENRLFLNSLNDLGAYSVAAYDALGFILPSKSNELKKPLYEIYNQIKQEFVTARFLTYTGLESTGSHFSDKNVRLANYFDDSTHSYHLELLRKSIASFYSIFGRISYFLNIYFDVGLDSTAVDYDAIWNQAGDWYSHTENIGLCGLYWIHKDLHWDRVQVPDSMDPGLDDVRSYRNSIEHRYLRVVPNGGSDESNRGVFEDSISRDELERATLRMAKKTRSAIICLCLAIMYNEFHPANKPDNIG